jgi:hypothetical protein
MSGWRDSGAAIKGYCLLAPTAFSFRGKIVEFGDTMRFLDSGGETEFALIVRPDFDIWYVDPRDFPEEAKTQVCALTFFFPPRPGFASDDDFIALSELI